MILARRRFLSLLPAPLIVGAASLMPIKVLRREEDEFNVEMRVIHEWSRDGVLIEGATGESYTLTAADQYATIMHVVRYERYADVPLIGPVSAWGGFLDIDPHNSFTLS